MGVHSVLLAERLIMNETQKASKSQNQKHEGDQVYLVVAILCSGGKVNDAFHLWALLLVIQYSQDVDKNARHKD